MDPTVENDVKEIAKEVYSEDLVRLRNELQMLKAGLSNKNRNLSRMNQYAVKYKKYKSARIQQASKKRDVINKIMTKYPVLQHSDIMPYIENAIIGPPEEVTLTIPAVYPKPTKSDMAVLLVYFNACSYKNLERNLRLTYMSLIDAEIPVFLVEHLFKDQEPIFPENGSTIFNTRSDSYMFYKENLLNWLMPRIPSQFTKFYMMDCDLIFSSPTWYDDVSALLDTHDVVQPFQEAIWLKSDLNTILHKRIGFAYGHNLGHTLNLSKYHPGFAWAFRRDFIEPIGIFDLNVLGSGDTILASAALQNYCIEEFWKMTNIEDDYKSTNNYINLFKNVRPTYYSNNMVYHLWHGSKLNREYNNRYTLFKQHCLKNNIFRYAELFEKNTYGIYEYKEYAREDLNNILLDYFKSRDEDGIE